MKKILALFCAFFALSIQTSKAVPILDVESSQGNWDFEVTFEISGLIPGDNFGRLIIDGVQQGAGIPNAPIGNGPQGGFGGLLPLDFVTSPLFSPGSHFVSIIFNRPGVGDIQVNGDEPYVLFAPTGPRPVLNSNVPEAGGTFLLLGSCLVAFAGYRRRLKRGDALPVLDGTITGSAT